MLGIIEVLKKCFDCKYCPYNIDDLESIFSLLELYTFYITFSHSTVVN